MTSIETETPPVNFPDFTEAFSYCEAFTPNLKHQQDLYDYCLTTYQPKILVNPELATQVDDLIDEGSAVIINANHRRFEDQFLIAAAIAQGALGKVIQSRPMRILAKSPYFENAAQRAFLYKIGAIPTPRRKDLEERDDYQGENDPRIERLDMENRHLGRLCVNLMKRRNLLTMFGSGERSAAQNVKKGIGHIIHLAQSEKLNVAVINSALTYVDNKAEAGSYYIPPPLLTLKGTAKDIATAIKSDLEKSVEIVEGIQPAPQSAVWLKPED